MDIQFMCCPEEDCACVSIGDAIHKFKPAKKIGNFAGQLVLFAKVSILEVQAYQAHEAQCAVQQAEEICKGGKSKDADTKIP